MSTLRCHWPHFGKRRGWSQLLAVLKENNRSEMNSQTFFVYFYIHYFFFNNYILLYCYYNVSHMLLYIIKKYIHICLMFTTNIQQDIYCIFAVIILDVFFFFFYILLCVAPWQCSRGDIKDVLAFARTFISAVARITEKKTKENNKNKGGKKRFKVFVYRGREGRRCLIEVRSKGYEDRQCEGREC